VWEIRVVVANDPHSGRSVQRSFTVHGDAESAQDHRRDLVERFAVDKSALYCAGVRWSVGELLVRFVEAEHQWKPATWSSHRSVLRFLAADQLAGLGLAGLCPAQFEGAMVRWRGGGASVAVVWARWAVLHSALSWAVAQGYLRRAHSKGCARPSGPSPADISFLGRWPDC
jgi:hypothetical protein